MDAYLMTMFYSWENLHQAVPVCCFSMGRVSTIRLIEQDITTPYISRMTVSTLNVAYEPALMAKSVT